MRKIIVSILIFALVAPASVVAEQSKDDYIREQVKELLDSKELPEKSEVNALIAAADTDEQIDAVKFGIEQITSEM